MGGRKAAPHRPRKAGGQTDEATPNVHVPAANTAAVVTLPAVAGRINVVKYLAWSYSGAPTGGRLSITDGGVTVFDVDITAGGHGSIPLGPGFQSGARNAAVVATLAAGGVGLTGKLSVGSALI